MQSSEIIEKRYKDLCNRHSDINEHLPTICELAKQAKDAAEFGVRGIVSTYALLFGLTQSLVADPKERRKLICVDIDNINMTEIQALGVDVGVDVEFICHDSATVEIPEVDLLWIDTWHVYEHLKRELNMHHTKVRKYIAMHDTEVDGVNGESVRMGYNIDAQARDSGYPIEGICIGLQPAINEFLNAHGDEWRLMQHYPNNNGMTVLERVNKKNDTV
jgi:hypothetical protein